MNLLDIYTRVLSTAAANWDVLYRTAVATTTNTIVGTVRLVEMAGESIAVPQGETVDVTVPQGALADGQV